MTSEFVKNLRVAIGWLVCTLAIFACLPLLLGGDQKEPVSVPSAKDNADSEFTSPVFQLKNWDKDVKKPEVEDDASNIIKESKDPDGKDTFAESDITLKTPPECLAGKLPPGNEKILWTPKWFFEGTGGIRLPAFSLSQDKSVLAVIETTGTNAGPNGSRVILFNTYNWQILRIHEFPENKITKLCFINERNRMALWSEKQTSIKKPYELIVTGIDKGGIKYYSREIKSEITDIISFDDHVLVKSLADAPESIYCFDSDDISKPAKRLSSSNSGGVFALSPDRTRFALAGNKSIEIFESAGLALIKKTEVDVDYTPENAVFAGRNDWFAISAYNKPAFFLKDTLKKQFCDISGHTLNYNSADKALFIEKYLNNQISVFEVPDLTEVADFIPANVTPKTKGYALFIDYLEHQNKYLMIDSYGNLCLYAKYLKSKKWKKKIILGVKR
ncbi:MAG: hypothetical protein NT118_13805 [Lentisphaerae bacterium]|nr:hypothetical protein [Lentisphaerota bacterium]